MKMNLVALGLLAGILRCSSQTGFHNVPLSASVNMSTLSEKENNSRQPIEMPEQGKPRDQASAGRSFLIPLHSTITFSALPKDFGQSLISREMPGRSGKKVLHRPSPASGRVAGTQSVTLQPLTLGYSNFGNGWDYSAPNDNDFAISDSGAFVSVVNSQIMTRKLKTNQVTTKALWSFAYPVNTSTNVPFDPKVMYDPLQNRFIIVCLIGFADSTSKAVIGFSKTDDPAGQWNIYELPGNPLNDSSWTDFPMFSITKKDMFFTVNLIKTGKSWQTGFRQTIVWQISKDSGYAGKTLATYLHSNIKFNGRPIRNLCPVKGGSKLYGPEMYFLSNRNFDAQNDTVFLVKIPDSLGSATHPVNVKVLRSQPYYLPAEARQAVSHQSLQTNDARNLGAFIENDMIQYVQNTNNPANGRATIGYGVIKSPAAANPTITSYIIHNDTMDFGYPNISYAGLDSTDNTAIIGFNHTSPLLFAGVSAMQANPSGNFSPIYRIQNGTSYVDIWPDDSLERWGDYTGSQRKYDKKGEVWMSGFVGCVWSGYKAQRTWIAQLNTYEGLHVGLEKQEKYAEGPVVFPNPSNEVVRVRLHLPEPEYLNFELYDTQGKLVAVLLREYARGTENIFTFRTENLQKGVYFLRIRGNKQTNTTEKIIVN